MVDLKSVRKPDLWYVVGLIATDGNLSKDGRHIDITSKHKPHLIAVRKALKIPIAIGTKSRGGNRDKLYFRLQFSDVGSYKFLLVLGLFPRKSLTLQKLCIDRCYFPDFLRGVIDGDGSISTWVHETNMHRQWSLRITSAAPIFIRWLKEETEKRFGVGGRLYEYARKDRKNPIFILKFGKLASKKILGEVYYPGAISLAGKKKKQIKCLHDPNKMINYGSVLGSDAETGNQDGLKIR